ncbi:MAG: ribosome maturation factor RimP [Nitrospira sp.]|nr:ribosome maturation factor RimP [Nitrospira sp.]
MRTHDRGTQTVVERVEEVASPILWALGLELVEVVWIGQGPRSTVRIVIDKPAGVTIADCERAHRALSPALDVADVVTHAYTLEVSSPGLDRPFKRLEDYQRAMGKEVSLKLRHPLDGRWRLVGLLEEVGEREICVAVADSREGVAEKLSKRRLVRLSRESIAEAKLVVKV